MQNVSNDFKNAIKDSAPSFVSRITFPGLMLDDTEVKSISWDSTLDSNNDFTIGLAPMDMVRIEIVQTLDNPIEYDFENKECEIELGLVLPDESVEYLPIGKYTVEKSTKGSIVTTLDCVDRMYTAEKEYVSDLMYPTTLGQILQSACDQAGLELATTTFANSDYIVPNEPVYEGITCRKVFAQVAELAGGCAKINRLGQLEILTLGTESVKNIDDFKYTINEVANAKIEKVIVKVGDETATKGDGEHIYTIVDNMFIQNPENVIDAVYDVLKKVEYTAYTMNRWQGDFSLDLGDKITIDSNETYILNRKLTYTGGLREDYSAPAKSNIEKESTGKGSLTLDIENVKTKIKVIDGEIQQTIERVENLVVGANNRLFDSQTEIMFGFNEGNGEIQLFRDQTHPYYKVTSDQTIDLFAAFPDSQFAESLGELGEVTISLDVLVDVDRVVTIDGKEFDVKANRWTRIHVTKSFDDNTTKRLRVRNPFSRKRTRDVNIGTKLIDNLSTNINTLYYRNLKVERGNVATDWTLTPEELEVDVDRMSSEIKQLADSISMIARRNENTGRLEVTPESIVAAIDTTDGVGRVKNVGVTIDERGLEIENGALIVRDANNIAVVTSDGLRVLYIFSSVGNREGWGELTIIDYLFGFEFQEVSLLTYIPDDLKIVRATLYTESMPTYLEDDYYGNPDGYYHAREMRLLKVDDFSQGFIKSQGFILEGFPTYPSKSDITSSTWGSRWSPSGNVIRSITTDISNHLNIGRNVFVIDSALPATTSNARYGSLVRMELVVEGFLRG